MRRLDFTDESVALIETLRKNETRRVIKLEPGEPLPDPEMCPVGAVGETAVVRQATRISLETWRIFPDGLLQMDYRTGGFRRFELGVQHAKQLVAGASESWRPPRFMFYWAARLFVRLTSIRVERVAQITEQGAIAEGCPSREAFAAGWDAINARRGYPFDGNVAVWAIGFDLIDAEESKRIGTALVARA